MTVGIEGDSQFVINFMNLYDLFMNYYGYNHKRFIKIYSYTMNTKLILWEFVIKLYFNLVDLQNDLFDR